jgi:hypothetical protein
MTQPFLKTLYVDPTFVGSETGSQDSPFSSIAAAIAAAPIEGCEMIVPPDATIVENITFPERGDWHVLSPSRTTTLSGSVICNCVTGQARYRLTNLLVSGTITGNNSFPTGAQLILEGALITGAINLTQSGSGSGWFANLRGNGAPSNSFGGGCRDLTVFGEIFAVNWSFLGDLTFNGVTYITNCRIQSLAHVLNTIAMAFGAALEIIGTVFVNKATVTGAGQTPMVMDAYSHGWAMRQGLTISGVTLTSREAPSTHVQLVNNTSVTVLVANAAPGRYRFDASLFLKATGGAGMATLRATYVNLLGSSREVLLHPPLDVSLPPGEEQSGSYIVAHNGGALSYRLAGITTAPGTQVDASVAIRRVD